MCSTGPKKKSRQVGLYGYMSRIITRSKNNVLEVYLTANLTAKICYSYQIATRSKFTATLISSVICHTKNYKKLKELICCCLVTHC